MSELMTVLQDMFNPILWTGDNFDMQDQNQIKELHARINALNPKLVIDAGCANNIHKDKINNLVGFDAMPYPNADQHCSILDATFNLNSADVVIAYGSLQFLDEQFTRENLKKIINWIKPNGLLEMKVNGRYINKESPPSDGRYWWNYDAITNFSNEFNLKFKIKPYSINWDHTPLAPRGRAPRIFWTWIKT